MFWIDKKRDKETAEDIAQGQIVIVTARWILILAGWVLALWDPDPLRSAWDLRVAIALLMGYSALNFFLTIQWVNSGRVLTETALVTSLADLALITTLAAALGPGNVYVFYLPAVLALAVTFPTSVTVVYTAAVVAAYGFIALERAGDVDMAEAQAIFTRLVVLAAVGFCGGLYRNLESERRQRRGRMFQVFRAAGPAEPDAAGGVQPGRERLEVES